MQLTSFKKFPSKWASESHTSRRASLDELGAQGAHLVEWFSYAARHHRCCPGRFLRATSGSSLALLLLLLRWGHLAVCRGGLRDRTSRVIAGSLLEGLMREATFWLKCMHQMAFWGALVCRIPTDMAHLGFLGALAQSEPPRLAGRSLRLANTGGQGLRPRRRQGDGRVEGAAECQAPLVDQAQPQRSTGQSEADETISAGDAPVALLSEYC